MVFVTRATDDAAPRHALQQKGGCRARYFSTRKTKEKWDMFLCGEGKNEAVSLCLVWRGGLVGLLGNSPVGWWFENVAKGAEEVEKALHRNPLND